MELNKHTDIDTYISSFAEDVRKLLTKVRTTIKEAAPEAKEKIGYGIPTFTLEGNLVHFGAYNHHIGFYPGPSAIETFKEELSDFELSKGAIKFPYAKPIPYDLITKIVKLRVSQNTAKAALKKKSR